VAGLRRVLASLAAVDHPRDRMRIVVAVDGPDPELEAVAADGGAAEVVVLPTNQGSYAARNAALDRIGDAAEVVLFTDSDAEVDPGWVRAHLATLERVPRSGGAVVFRMSDRPRPAEVVDARRHLDQRFYVEQLGYAATVNLGVRREVVVRVRFDASLRSGGDFEFGRRAAAEGFAIAYSPDAVVTHPARATARQLLAKIERVASGARDLADAGHDASRRRRTRTPLADAAAEYGFRPGPWWLTRAWAIDRACSVAFARRVPSVVGPAVRRRLSPRGAHR
jgi:GT2 family glycosyltransferase